MSKSAFKIKNLSQLIPMQGVSYSPAPSDDTVPPPPQRFFDTDFANSSFPLLWGPRPIAGDTATKSKGRDDIKNLSKIGVNFIHLYNWSVPPAPGSSPSPYQRNHLPFLTHCANHNVKVFVPISNYFMELIHNGGGTSSAVKADIAAMVAEVYSTTDAHGNPAAVAGVGMWGVANEYDLATTTFDVNDVATAMAYLVEAETAANIPADNLLPVTSPVSFVQTSLPPGIEAIQNLQIAIKANKTLTVKKKKRDFWKDRFVASTNPFNGGEFLTTYISTTFPKYFPDVPFFFAEMGCSIPTGTSVTTEKEQAKFVATQLAATVPNGNFIGRCVFQFLDQTAMKTGTETTFGMNKFPPTKKPTSPIPTGKIQPTGYVPGGGETYNVDPLTQKPLYAIVKTAYA